MEKRMNNEVDKKSITSREFLKHKLMVNVVLHDYDDQKKQVLNLMWRSILCGESDSLLLIGPRGCGKTTLVSTCLKELEQECELSDNYIVINLSGLVHTDDKLALKDIIQQLHVNELDGDSITGSFSDNLFFVLQSLKSGNRKTSKTIIFILDEFQLFCNHRNQTLLYNLFDVAQSAQAPICVIGLTPRIDIVELLEKRVKSRFSHRQVMLYPNNNIHDRILLIVDYLCLPEESKLLVKPLDKCFARSWNDKVLEVFKSRKIILLVKTLLELDPSERKLKSWLFLVLSKISKDNPFITQEIIEEVIECKSDARIELLKDLSVLEFCLLIAMSHHNEIYEGEPFNFEMIFKRYIKFANQNYVAQITHRPILLKAFERLSELELVVPLGGGNKTFKKEYQLYNLLVTNSQVKEAAVNYSGLPTDVLQWASSNISCL